MNRQEYIFDLRSRLTSLPENEINEAMRYYSEFFDDAGVENEQDVIEKLGSPSVVAAQILMECSQKALSTNVINTGATDNQLKENNFNSNNNYKPQQEYKAPKSNPTSSTILKIVLIILALPIALPLGFAFLAVVFAISLTIFALLASITIAGFALLLSGVLLFAIGVINLFIAPGKAVLALGVSLLLVGFGTLITILFVNLLVLTFKGLIKLLNKIFNKGGSKRCENSTK